MLISTRSRIWLLTIVMPVLATPVKAAEVNKYLPDSTDVVAVLNVKQILGSPLMQKGGLDQLKEFVTGTVEDIKHLESVGIDPFKDVAKVTLGMTISKDGLKVFLIAEGTFNSFEQKAAELAKEKPGLLKVLKEGSHKIYEFKSEEGEEKPDFVTLIDKTTIIASNEKPYVLDALAKAGGNSGHVRKDLRGLIEKADANQSLWFAVPSSSLSTNEMIANNPEARNTLEKLENITGSLCLSHDLQIALNFVTKSPDAAKEIAGKLSQVLDQYKGMITLAATGQKELAGAVEIVDAMKVETSGRNVSLKAHASEDAMQKSLKKD
jgi:hypothetical protein